MVIEYKSKSYMKKLAEQLETEGKKRKKILKAVREENHYNLQT